MTENQYHELIQFLGKKFDRVDRRFDLLEGRVAAVEVGQESLRGEMRLVAEGVKDDFERINRLESTMNSRFDHIELILLDQGRRMQTLEDR